MKKTKIPGWKISALLLSAFVLSQPSWNQEARALSLTDPSRALVQLTLSFTAHHFALNAKEASFVRLAKIP